MIKSYVLVEYLYPCSCCQEKYESWITYDESLIFSHMCEECFKEAMDFVSINVGNTNAELLSESFFPVMNLFGETPVEHYA